MTDDLPGRGKRVLIVEDEPLLAVLMEAELAQAGFEIVGPVTEIEEAERLAREVVVDAAVLNIHIQDQTIYEAIRPLVERNIPFLFVSSAIEPPPPWLPPAPRFPKATPMKTVIRKLMELLDSRGTGGAVPS